MAKRKKFKTEEAFIDAEVKKPKASNRLERGDGVFYQVYTPKEFGKGLRCFCSLAKRLPEGETMSSTYSICSQAFAQTYWNNVLGRPVKVELIHSCLTGAEECRFAINL